MQPGFAAGFANQLPQAEGMYQRLIAGRQQLQEAARRQQAAEAFFKSLVTPDAAAIPQQGPPGLQQPQAPQPQPAMAGGAPSGPAPMPGGGPGPAAGVSPASPSPAMPPAGGSPVASAPPAGGAQFDPTQRLRQMAMRIKQANPGVDNQTLSMALDKEIETMRGVAPEDRVLMQLELAQQKFQNSRDIAMLRDDLGRLQEKGRNDRAAAGNDTRLAVTDRNNATRTNIADQTNQTRTAIADTNEKGRNGRAQARIDASKADAGTKTQYKALMAERMAVKDKIAAFQNGTPGAPKKEEVAQLQAKLQQLDSQVSALWSRNPTLPRPSELDRAPADKPAAAPTADGAAPAAAIPDGAPTATDDKGNKVYWDGKAWVPAPKG